MILTLLLNPGPLFLSLKLALITTFILLLAGLPLAWWLSVTKNLFTLVIEVLVTMPLVLPPTVLGFYLLIAFNPTHNPAKWLLQHLNLQLTFTFSGLLVGSILYSLPFMITPLKSAFQQIPESLSQASLTLGKSRFETFFLIILPAIKPAIISAIILSFAHTLGEFGVVLMIGGNIPDKTRLASMAIYDAVERMDYESAEWYAFILFSATFILVSTVFMFNRHNRYSIR